MVAKVVIFLTILVYGVNIELFFYIKANKIKDAFERFALYLGTNMTLLFTSTIFLFFGKLVEDEVFSLL